VYVDLNTPEAFLEIDLNCWKKNYIFFFVILFPLSISCLIFFSIELLNFYPQFWFHYILYSWKLTICCNEMTLHQWFLIFQERTEKIKQILENQVAYVQNVIKPQILSQFIAEHVCIKIECFDSLFSMWLTPIVLSYIEKKVLSIIGFELQKLMEPCLLYIIVKGTSSNFNYMYYICKSRVMEIKRLRDLTAIIMVYNEYTTRLLNLCKMLTEH